MSGRKDGRWTAVAKAAALTGLPAMDARARPQRAAGDGIFVFEFFFFFFHGFLVFSKHVNPLLAVATWERKRKQKFSIVFDFSYSVRHEDCVEVIVGARARLSVNE